MHRLTFLLLLSFSISWAIGMPNISIRQWTIDTLFSINFSKESCFYDSLGIRDVGRLSFVADEKDTTVYVYDRLLRRLVKRNLTGSTISVEPNLQFNCMGIFNNRLLIFDGKSQFEYSADSLKFIRRVLIITDNEYKKVSGISFYYAKHLFAGNFSMQDSFSRVYFIYDLQRNALSKDLRMMSGFMPITNCTNCDPVLMDALFRNISKDMSTFYNYYAQSANMFLFSRVKYEKQAKHTNVNFYLYDKANGLETELVDLRRIKMVGGSHDVQFFGDNCLLVQCLKQQWKGKLLLPVGIQYCLIRW